MENPDEQSTITLPEASASQPQTRAKWLQSISEAYNSRATSTFLLYGNVWDIFPHGGKDKSLADYLTAICGKRDIVLQVDPASDITLELGNAYSDEAKDLLVNDGTAIMERLHRFLLYIANLKTQQNVTVFLTNSNYLVGERNDVKGGLLLKRWTEDPHFTQKGILLFLIADSLKDIHETIVGNQRIQKIEVPFPNKDEVQSFLENQKKESPVALQEMKDADTLKRMASAMAGTSMHSLLSLIKLANYTKKPLEFKDLEEAKKRIVEQESKGLITFLTPKNTLADLAGDHCRHIQAQFEGDITLWNQGRINLIPNGYLIVGPSGTGKTFFLRCLAGSTGIPIMQINNFRGEYQGQTESNLELIFRLAKSMPRVFIAIDEADQSLGGRSQSNTDGGVSGRVYSYFAQEMSNLDNRGKICWVLLTSHPHNLEVDLKRPGRCDVRIPLLPCESPEAARKLLADIAKRAGLECSESDLIPGPELLTPGGATTIVENAVRLKAQNKGEATDAATLNKLIAAYQPPDPQKMWDLTQRAIAESSSKDFIPEVWWDLNEQDL